MKHHQANIIRVALAFAFAAIFTLFGGSAKAANIPVTITCPAGGGIVINPATVNPGPGDAVVVTVLAPCPNMIVTVPGAIIPTTMVGQTLPASFVFIGAAAGVVIKAQPVVGKYGVLECRDGDVAGLGVNLLLKFIVRTTDGITTNACNTGAANTICQATVAINNGTTCAGAAAQIANAINAACVAPANPKGPLGIVQYPSQKSPQNNNTWGINQNGNDAVDLFGLNIPNNGANWDFCMTDQGAFAAPPAVGPDPQKQIENADGKAVQDTNPITIGVNPAAPPGPANGIKFDSALSASLRHKKKQVVPALPPIGVGLLGAGLATVGGLLLRRKRKG